MKSHKSHVPWFWLDVYLVATINFVGELLPFKNVIIHSQDIKFSRPVYLDNTVVLSAEVVEVVESVQAYVFKYQFKNQSEACVAKGKIQIGVI